MIDERRIIRFRFGPIQWRAERGRFAILTIGRLAFHAVVPSLWTIGWISDEYDYYHPSLHMEF